MVLDRMRSYFEFEAQQLEQLSHIRKTLLAKLGEAGNETRGSAWEVFFKGANSETTSVHLKGQRQDEEFNVKIFARKSKSEIQEVGGIDYSVRVRVIMGGQKIGYTLTPNLRESRSYKLQGNGSWGSPSDFESCVELHQLAELIEAGKMEVVENS